MISETLKEVLKQEGVVAIATLGADGPHMVNTWNSYIQISERGELLIPAGYFHKTESNIGFNPQVLITMGSSKIRGLNGPGTGFLLKGTAAFQSEGAEFEKTKARFKWARAVLVVTITSATQTL